MHEGRKVAFYTLGCKLNFSETSTIKRDLEKAGFETTPFDSAADLYVINTCSVTDQADKKCRYIVRQALKQNPHAYISIIGCYAQLQPEQIASMEGVDLVLGASEKFSILEYLGDLDKQEKGEIHSCEITEADTYESAFSISERTRAFLKVQDGCDYVCTYCTIPLARGISRSARLEKVLDQAAEIASEGIKEIVLTGVNIGDYGKGEFGNKRHEHTFLDLIRELDKVDPIDRIRISSIEPNLLKDDIIQIVAGSQRFVPHFHIPLQSGTDDILKKMKRRYNTQLYKERIHRIKELMPEACIGVDVIVGFPGETDEMFLETYNFLNELPISYLHVFTYSERPNTEAIEMQGSVDIAIRRKRNKMLRILSSKKRNQFYREHLGSRRKVLFEAENKAGFIHGFTDNYIKVKTYYDPALHNAVFELELKEIDADGLVRVLVEQNSPTS
jgi:threonylcarbamoyladenosine tRNA methylthiotransferase MtaB